MPFIRKASVLDNTASFYRIPTLIQFKQESKAAIIAILSKQNLVMPIGDT